MRKEYVKRLRRQRRREGGSLQSSDYSLRSEKCASLAFATPRRGYALSEKLDFNYQSLAWGLKARKIKYTQRDGEFATEVTSSLLSRLGCYTNNQDDKNAEKV